MTFYETIISELLYQEKTHQKERMRSEGGTEILSIGFESLQKLRINNNPQFPGLITMLDR